MTSEELAAEYQKIAAVNPLHTRREIAYMLINRRIVKDCTLKGLESRLTKIQKSNKINGLKHNAIIIDELDKN